jgi:hypothetical protein
MYAGDAQGEEQTADASAEEGQYGNPVGPEADAPAEEAPVEEAPAEEAPVDDTAGTDDSSS